MPIVAEEVFRQVPTPIVDARNTQWISRRRAAALSLLLLAAVAFALFREPLSPWVRLPGGEVSSGDSTASLDRVRFNRLTRELRGRVTWTGLEVTGDVRIETFDALLIDQVTWEISPVPVSGRLRTLQPGGPVVLDGYVARVPDGLMPYGVDVEVSFLRANGERGTAGLGWGMYAHQVIDDAALQQIVARGPRVVPDLLRRSYDSDADAREVAAMALGGIGVASEPVVARLRALLGDPHTAVRMEAIHALGRLGTGALSAVPDLARVARDTAAHEVLRRAALLAFRTLGPTAERAVPDLIAVIKGGNGLHRLLALHALGAIGPRAEPAVDTLLDLLEREDMTADVRTAVADTLASIRGS